MEPVVSILIAAHNAEPWLAETLDSALNQSWRKTEVILVDDGSTDRTIDVAKQFESPKLKILRQEKSGACSARNRAYREAQGDYIQWLDADDLLDTRKIEFQVSAIAGSSDRTVFSGAWARFYYRTSHARFVPTHLWQDLGPIDWLTLRFSKRGMMPNHCWLLSRSITELAGPWNESLIRNQDGEYFCRVVSFSDFVRFVPKSLCYYRRGNSSSVSSNSSKEALASVYRSFDLSTERLLKLEDSERTRRACASLFDYYVSDLCRDESLAGIAVRKIIDLGETGRVLSNKRASPLAALTRLSGRLARIRGRLLQEWDRVQYLRIKKFNGAPERSFSYESNGKSE